MGIEALNIIPSEANGKLTTTERRVRLGRVYDCQSRREDLTIDNCEVLALSRGSEHECSQRRRKA